MSSGLSFCVCLLLVAVGGSVLLLRAVRRLDELEEMDKRRQAWADLGLPSSQPPSCLRELDPQGPFDWQALDG